jgi:RNA polymerase sigma-70 factor, ECF subfamily
LSATVHLRADTTAAHHFGDSGWARPVVSTERNQPQSAADEAFRCGLIALIPHMRAFARTLCRDTARAEDLAQDALASAWAGRSRYSPDTNLRAWAFMIVRHQFYSDQRRVWRTCALDPEVAERTLVAVTNPDSVLELDEMRRAIAMLPVRQREALIMIGAGGLSYGEVAEICGVAMGTVKSRVCRARDQLALILAAGDIDRDGLSPSSAMEKIFTDVSAAAGSRAS